MKDLAPRALVLFLLGSVAQADPLDGISFNHPVVDQAQMMDGVWEGKITVLARRARAEGGPHIGVVTLPSLQGQSIEEVSIRIAEAWQLGTAEEDNGVIITVAKKERRVRIEVGQGLEGDLPDAYAKRIIDHTITPSFKLQRFGEGLHDAVVEVLSYTVPKLVEGERKRPKRRGQARAGDYIKTLVYLMTIILVSLILLSGRVGRIRRSGYSSMGYTGWGGGSGGGFSGGGGGFSGGGGGFSGGGASGGW